MQRGRVYSALLQFSEIEVCCTTKDCNSELGELIRVSGSFTRKVQYLMNISAWFLANDDVVQTMSTEKLRQYLLALNGVGEETADSILLYVFNRGKFIYDTHARKLLAVAGFGNFITYL
ncbi:MAG: hypothetical protein ACRDAX_06645 [Propionibacteriaceae bacterium]